MSRNGQHILIVGAGMTFGGGPVPKEPEAEGQRLIDRIKSAL